MIHLIKQNGKFRVVDVAANHEVIKESQRQGLTTRKAAIKNIRATARLYDAKIGYELMVQDDTGAQPRMIIVSETSVSASSEKPGRPFRPGKMRSPGTPVKRAVKKAVPVKLSPLPVKTPQVRTIPAKNAPTPAKKAATKKASAGKK